MITRPRKITMSVLGTLLIMLYSTFPAFAVISSRDQYARLRVDQSQVNASRDYTSQVYTILPVSINAPTSYDVGTFMYVQIPTAQGIKYIELQMYSYNGNCNFCTGFGWRVSFSPGFSYQCLRGVAIGSGNNLCGSTRSDTLVGGYNWHTLELVTYLQGFWIARLRNQNTNQVFDLAKIYISDSTINNMRVGTRFTDDNFPYVGGAMYHLEPKYMIWNTGFTLWPSSSGGNNNVLVSNLTATECNIYHKTYLNIGGNPRYWYSGWNDAAATGVCTSNPMF